MAINIVRFEFQDLRAWGVLRGDVITPIPGTFDTTGALLGGTKVWELKKLKTSELRLDQVKLHSPVTQNQQFVCQGANYRQHMIESGMDPDAKHYNMIFTKASTCIVAADSDVIKPTHVRFLDYEIEMGLVLRKAITGPLRITEENLLDYVAGLVIVNDYSARDIQIPQMQFYKGKSFRTFGPVGPYLCLLEPGDQYYLTKLQLCLTVNGQIRQQDSTANLVHRPAETLTELSHIHDFAPGDLIATGTPSGCALAVPSPFKQRIAGMLPEALKWKAFSAIQAKRIEYLNEGDKVEAAIRSADGVIDLGTQRNLIVGDR